MTTTNTNLNVGGGNGQMAIPGDDIVADASNQIAQNTGVGGLTDQNAGLGQIDASQIGQEPASIKRARPDTHGKVAELDRRQLADLGLKKREETAILKFADTLSQALDKGEWKKLSHYWANPDHKHTQVDGMGMGYPQYVAELLELHSVDNNIQTGNVLSAEDMDRLKDVDFSRTMVNGDDDGPAANARFWFDNKGDFVVLEGVALVRDAANWRETDELKISVVIDMRPVKQGRQPDLIGAVG